MKKSKPSRNPLSKLYQECLKIFYRCPYWRKCPYFNRDKCHEAWIMRQCSRYRQYENQEGEETEKAYQQLLKEGKLQ